MAWVSVTGNLIPNRKGILVSSARPALRKFRIVGPFAFVATGFLIDTQRNHPQNQDQRRNWAPFRARCPHRRSADYPPGAPSVGGAIFDDFGGLADV